MIADQSEKHSYRELLTLYHLDNQLSVKDYHPVTATVVAKSPNVWYSTVTIDKGESSGVHVNDPVINGEGLIGKVAQAASDGAQVTLITDSSVGVSARIGSSNATGIVQPKVGDPNDLLLQYLPANTQANRGEYVVTSGTVSSPDDSLYPPGIPIGQVTSVNEESAYRSVNVHPLADLHNLDVVQVLTAAQRLAALQPQPPRPSACRQASRPGRARGEAARRDRRRRMNADFPSALLARIAVLGVLVVFFQIGVVSEVPVFGVSADLSPLLVAFVGLLCGSTVGAATGFAVGLLVDLALVQTLGVTSLTLTVVGYWAGRLREVRDPQAALTPLLVGAAAARPRRSVGYSVVQFLLGVDAPVSLELLRQIVLGVVVNTIVALPVWAIVRRCLIGGLPDDPRRRRRRAYTTGGLSPCRAHESGHRA